MASSLSTKLRIAGSILFATGFFDALLGRFLLQTVPEDKSSSDFPLLPLPDGLVAQSGALHIHSTYSDGGGDIPTVMEGAREAGVDFVLLTDHNSQQPLRDGWENRYNGDNGYPLLLIGTEITVEKGAFLLALEMPPEWDPTKHQPPQVAIDEVNQYGGIPLVSLPFDIKHPWVAWDATGCMGLEVVNLSTVARRHINILSLLWLLPVGRLGGMMAALRALLTRPDAAMERWDRLTDSGHPQVGIGALDAHALMKIGKKKYPIPNYTDSMRVLTTHVLIPAQSADNATANRKAIYQALRQGHCYIAYDCLGDPRPFHFSAVGAHSAMQGDTVTRKDGSVCLRAICGNKSLLRLYYKGRVVTAGIGSLHYDAKEPGAYRVEVYQFAGRLGSFFYGTRPWIFSNPIYVV